MQIARITLWDGRVFHTDDFSQERLRTFFDNLRKQWPDPVLPGMRNQVDLIEMTPEEYAAIPATVESAQMFSTPEQHAKP